MSPRGRILIIILIILLGILFVYLIWPEASVKSGTVSSRTVIGTFSLPTPQISTNVSVENAIQNRHSIRQYTNESLSLQDVSQLLWASQGITDTTRKFRAAPSAGHTYPLEVYIMVGKGGVNGIDEGLYHYDPQNHRLEKILNRDLRADFSKAAHGQQWVNDAPVNIIITGVYSKMINKYKDEKLSTRFVDMEAGHVGENIYLEVEARNLATVAIGSFYEDQVIELLRLPANETPLYIYPVGHSAKG